MVVYITIGQIPESSKSLFIYCGDYSSQETVEFNFCIKDNMLVGIDNDFSCAYKTDIFKLQAKSVYARIVIWIAAEPLKYVAIHSSHHNRPLRGQVHIYSTAAASGPVLFNPFCTTVLYCTVLCSTES